MTLETDQMHDGGQESPGAEGRASGSAPTMWRTLLDFRLWLICAGFLAIGVLGLNEKMMYSPDCSRYVLWANSLAAFQGFANFSGPEPVRYVVHAPFYPIMLAPLAWVFTDIVIPAKVLTLLCGLALLVLFYLWTSRWGGTGIALLGTFFLAVNSLTLLFADHILSDIPFIATAVIFFMLAEQMVRYPSEERWGWWLVLALTIGIFLREIGLTLLLGAVSYLLLTRQYKRLLLVFTIPMLFYLLWYFRNEVYYAGLENPPIRNMRLLMGHYFTADGDSIIKEFWSRITANAYVYLRWGRGLILFPQYLSQSYQAVAIPGPLMAGMNSILQIAQYPLIVLQYGLFMWGLVVGWRRRPTTLLVVLFALFYMGIVLLYPINDLRFLVPMMVLVLHYCMLGVKDISARFARPAQKKIVLGTVTVVIVALLAAPNLLWAYGYVRGNDSYRQGGSDPTREAGEWIAQHSDKSAAVFSRWGEVALWLDGRKLLITDHLLSLTLFDSYIRDYNVRYIVSYVTEPGIRDYEFQMLQTKKYLLTPVFRTGRLEVIQIDEREGIPDPHEQTASAVREGAPGLIPAKELDARKLFAQGVGKLEGGDPNEALRIFSALLETSGSGYVGLFCGISLEIAGQYDDALKLYGQLRNQLQAGPFILHARYHTNLIKNLERADGEASPSEKAEIYQRVSSAFWDLGFRRFAVQLLEKSLNDNPTFAPSLIFGMYYSLQRGDTLAAREYYQRMRKSNPTHAILSTIQNIFETLDSVRTARTQPERTDFQIRLARGYALLGLVDATIDESLSILQKDSVNVSALQLLAEGYDLKDRIAPAVQVLQKLVRLNPGDEVAREKLARLDRRM